MKNDKLIALFERVRDTEPLDPAIMATVLLIGVTAQVVWKHWPEVWAILTEPEAGAGESARPSPPSPPASPPESES
jgi:hypothetical protein